LCLEASVFRKSRKSQPILKISSKKIIQETSLRCKESLPIALLHTRIAPKEEVGLSTYEMLYGRPFVYVNDLFLDPEAQTLPVLYHENSTRYMLGGCQPGPKRF